jgi:hypothetical protein
MKRKANARAKKSANKPRPAVKARRRPIAQPARKPASKPRPAPRRPAVKPAVKPRPVVKPRRPASKPRDLVRTMTRAEISRRFAQQKEAARLVNQRKRAKAARVAYKPRKADYGKLIMVGVKGQRDPGKKGRKGFPVYVTRTGKKWLIKQKHDDPYAPRKLTDLALPIRRNLQRAEKEFQRRRLVEVTRGKAVKSRGNIKTGGAHDFSQKVVKKLAKALHKTMVGQESHRTFLLTANLIVRGPDGKQDFVQVAVPIDRADHVAIKLAGIDNFIGQKFYAFMAQQLAYLGYITAGSANHIRQSLGQLEDEGGEMDGDVQDSLANGEVNETVWEYYHNEHKGHNLTWSAPRFEIVTIERIEWKIEQSR